jgi:hypothetical protein
MKTIEPSMNCNRLSVKDLCIGQEMETDLFSRKPFVSDTLSLFITSRFKYWNIGNKPAFLRISDSSLGHLSIQERPER